MMGGNVAFLRGAASIDVLSWVDYVVTDYSAVAFEAAVASKKVLFYVPDIEEYRRSPGLNVDPLEEYRASFHCKTQIPWRALWRPISGRTAARCGLSTNARRRIWAFETGLHEKDRRRGGIGRWCWLEDGRG